MYGPNRLLPGLGSLGEVSRREQKNSRGPRAPARGERTREEEGIRSGSLTAGGGGPLTVLKRLSSFPAPDRSGSGGEGRTAQPFEPARVPTGGGFRSKRHSAWGDNSHLREPDLAWKFPRLGANLIRCFAPCRQLRLTPTGLQREPCIEVSVHAL